MRGDLDLCRCYKLNPLPRWCAVGFASLQIIDWDGEFTVFQPAVGKTHFLNEMGLRILLLLNQSPATLEQICQQLAEHFSLAPDESFLQQIQQTLQRFEALGLVVSVNPPQ